MNGIAMSETKEKDKKKKPLGLSRPGTLELNKTIESGQVRQSFSHGRSKMVQVEVRKKRTYTQNDAGRMAEVKEDLNQLMKAAEEAVEVEDTKPEVVVTSPVGSNLTGEEKAARARALQDAKVAGDKAAAAAKLAPPEPEVEPEPEPEPDASTLEEVKRQAEEEELHKKEQAAASASAAAQKLEAAQSGDGDPVKARTKHAVLRPEEPKRPTPKQRGEKRRRSGKLTIAEALVDGEERTRSLASVKRAREKEKQKQKKVLSEGKKIIRDVVIPESITVQELANRMAERSIDVIKALMRMDVMATIEQEIDADTAELVVSEFGHNLKRVSDSDVEIGLKDGGDDDSPESMKSRPPVVTVMGHVDHGKTSLLDALRATDVAAREAGGITQHIGAYQVTIDSGEKITFVDTPGHAAFSAMRARGAKVTDIVVLVVAADDGIMPQTVEAISHAKAAGVPIIVAINKMDVAGADADRVRQGLLQHDLVVEEMGGEVITVEVSAKEKTNLDKLEEMILLQAELLDLKANPDRPAEGVVVESKMESGRGSIATILVQRGTLKVGDIIVAGGEWGRVRALVDGLGQKNDEVGPSMPIEVLGLNGAPEAGDEVAVVEDESRAREVSEFRQRRVKEARHIAGARGSLEEMFEKIGQGEVQTLPVVLKADAHGSVEAISAALEKMATDEVKVEMLHSGVGGVNEADITLANASGGFVIGFNVRANPQARAMAKRDGVDIRYYSIIYNVIDDLRDALSGMLSPTLRENLLGYAEILEVFGVSKVGKVAGCLISEGMVKRGASVRLLRDDVVIHEGELSQLKRFKDDVKEVKEGIECGMAFANYEDIKVGDRIECFEIEEIARKLEAS
jgi:translation initiation factor IF-2